MSRPPTRPKLFHITHADNLPSILEGGALLSDAVMIERGGPTASIGMGRLKQRRLRLPVACHPGDHVGDFVPFYFCPRSVMLYLIHCANHPDLAYRGGQGPIVHLQADLRAVVAWADANDIRWAFSLSNAAASFTEFRTSLDHLDALNWRAIATHQWQAVKEAKQAELLVHRSFPWTLVERVGVLSEAMQARVVGALATTEHKPEVVVRRDWYD